MRMTTSPSLSSSSTPSTLFTKSYFSIIKELKQNNTHLLKEEPKKPLTKITEGIYSKYSSNIEDYIKRNKNSIQFRGTMKYDNISIDSFIAELQSYKQTVLSKIKDNPSLIPIFNEPVPEEEIILTPLPEQAKAQTELNGKMERNDFNSAKRTAVVMRIVEYTHRFKREGMHPKRNIFGKRIKAKRLLDDNSTVFIVMKNAVDRIERWWLRIKKRKGADADKGEKAIYLKKGTNRRLPSSIVNRPVIFKCYCEKVMHDYWNVICLQRRIRGFLQRERLTEVKPISLPIFKLGLISKEVKLIPALFLNDNDVVSFRDMNEHSIRLNSFNVSQKGSLPSLSSIALELNMQIRQEENSFCSKHSHIDGLFNVLLKIGFSSLLNSLLANNKKKAILKAALVLSRRLLIHGLKQWRYHSRIDSHSCLIEMKSKKHVHSFVYKSKRFRNQPCFTSYVLSKGLLLIIWKVFNSASFKAIKQRQAAVKCGLFSSLLLKACKRSALDRLILLKAKPIAVKAQLIIESDESDEEVIEQEDEYSSDTLTERESLNEYDRHPQIIPLAIQRIFSSRNKEYQQSSDLNKSIDRTPLHQHCTFPLRYEHSTDKSKSVDKIRFVPNKSKDSRNRILLRDDHSIDHDNLI